MEKLLDVFLNLFNHQITLNALWLLLIALISYFVGKYNAKLHYENLLLEQKKENLKLKESSFEKLQKEKQTAYNLGYQDGYNKRPKTTAYII